MKLGSFLDNLLCTNLEDTTNGENFYKKGEIHFDMR